MILKIKNYISKIKYFSFGEIIQIVQYTIGSLLIGNTSNGLKHTYHFILYLRSLNIDVKSKNGAIFFSYRVNFKNFIFKLRRDSSDSEVFKQVIINEEYLNLIELIKRNNIKIEFILDFGANIGLSTIYFFAFFEEVKIVSIEPEKNNYSSLEFNINKNEVKNAHLINCGVWNEETTLTINRSFRDGLDWSVNLVKSQGVNEIKVYTVLQIIEKFDIPIIDILKIDIEGAEKEIFLMDNDIIKWIKKVKIIVIEIHDETNSRDKILSRLENFNFEITHYRDLTIGINRNLVN